MRRSISFLLLLLLLLPTTALASGAIALYDTNDSLEMETSAAVSTDFKCSYLDTTTTATTPTGQSGNANTATTTVIVSAPAASTQRKVSGCSIYNRSTTATQTVTIKFDDNTTERHLFRVVLQPLESVWFNEEDRWKLYMANGMEKVGAYANGFFGFTASFYKLGTASEAVAQRYFYAKDSGFPGAWIPGAAGLNGTATDCSTTAGASSLGSPYLPNPSSGSYFLASGQWSQTVSHYGELIDVLWWNTSIVVTTTTAQGITTPAWPSRDCFGTTNGYGIQAGIYVQTATTNAGAVTNTTLSYTDQDGNAGATATISSFPATAVAGTFVPFQLAAGDSGIRSIQSITLGTSYGAGAIHLIAYRPLGAFGAGLVNQGGNFMGTIPAPAPPGTRLYNGTCLWLGYISSATTLTNTSAQLSVVER